MSPSTKPNRGVVTSEVVKRQIRICLLDRPSCRPFPNPLEISGEEAGMPVLLKAQFPKLLPRSGLHCRPYQPQSGSSNNAGLIQLFHPGKLCASVVLNSVCSTCPSVGRRSSSDKCCNQRCPLPDLPGRKLRVGPAPPLP